MFWAAASAWTSCSFWEAICPAVTAAELAAVSAALRSSRASAASDSWRFWALAAFFV
jgi:hypothetical protein